MAIETEVRPLHRRPTPPATVRRIVCAVCQKPTLRGGQPLVRIGPKDPKGTTYAHQLCLKRMGGLKNG